MSDDDRDLWDELASGNLSDDEEALLRVLAEGDPDAEADADWEGELAARLEAFAPLGEDFEEALARRIERERDAKASLEPGASASAQARVLELNTVKAAALAPPPRPSNLIRLIPVAGAPALAAAIALVIQPWNSAPGADALALPAYSLALRGGVARLRHGEPEEGTPRFDAHSRLDLTLTPASRVDTPLEVAVFLVQDGRAQRLDAVRAEVRPSGAIRVRAPGAEIFGASPRAGAAALALVVFAAGRAPDEEVMREAIAGRRGVVLFAAFEILPEAQP